MVSVNTVILGGNLTRDPEVRYTPQGTAVASFSLAVSRIFRTREGQQKEDVCFIEVEAWGRQAETCGEYLKKGRAVLVEGRLTQDRWETQDGQKRSRHKVRAMRVQFLPRAAQREEAEVAPAPAPFEDDFPPESPLPEQMEKEEKGEEEIPF